MKRIFIRLIFPVTLLLLVAGPARAADIAGNAAAVAAQQEAEERYKQMAATVEEMKETQAAQQKKIAALAAELEKLREEVVKAGNNAATTDSLKRLADQIQEVDKKRVTDNERILAEFARLGKAISAGPGTPRTHPPDPTPPNPPPVPSGEGFDYVIAKNDTLGDIVMAYRKQGINVTRKLVMDANPTVKWEALRIGQKIFIPKPK